MELVERVKGASEMQVSVPVRDGSDVDIVVRHGPKQARHQGTN